MPFPPTGSSRKHRSPEPWNTGAPRRITSSTLHLGSGPDSRWPQAGTYHVGRGTAGRNPRAGADPLLGNQRVDRAIGLGRPRRPRHVVRAGRLPRRGVAAGALDTVSSGPGGTTGNEQSAGTLRGDRVDRPQGAVRPAVPSFFPRRVRNRRLTLAAPVATCSRSRGGDMRERMPGRTLGAVRKSETGR